MENFKDKFYESPAVTRSSEAIFNFPYSTFHSKLVSLHQTSLKYEP